MIEGERLGKTKRKIEQETDRELKFKKMIEGDRLGKTKRKIEKETDRDRKLKKLR